MDSSKKKDGSLLVSRSLLRELAGELRSEWLELGRILRVSDASLDNIKEDNRGNTKEAKYQMLICWEQASGNEATHNLLSEALLKAGRKRLAERVQHEADNPRKRSVENEISEEHAASSSKRQRPTEEPSVNRSVVGDGEKKTQFLTELKKKYKNLCGEIQPAPFLRNKYDIDKLFVGGEIKFLAEKQIGGREQENWIGLGDYTKIFTEPQIKSKRHIIDGEPGYGKSTLALQITHDWCQEKAPMNKFEILILLRLNQFKNVANVFSAIKKFLLPTDSKLTEDDIKGILDSSSTVILLDGYDEYPGRGKKTSVIELIIGDEMFQKHEVVLTTRTSCLPPKYSRDTKRIRLTGFDKDARDAYIKNVVARGSTEDADKINHFFDTNPVPADLCKSPLFFAMISYMVHNHDKTFHNLTTVTEFFRHIIQCFLSHDEVREGEEERKEELDHSKLDEIAFEGLSGGAQQISWDKNKLSDQIGNNLYDQYVRIGILIEEESYDSNVIGYRTETRFFHKLFAEWYAAHYLAKKAALSETEFEPLQNPRSQAADTSQPHRAANSKKLGLHLLENLDPDDVHYMYRYSCGLKPKAALKIIKHLAKNEDYDKYTLLCIADWGGSLETIMETVKLLCSRTIEFRDTDSLLLQKSTVALVEFASSRKIPMDSVFLYDCLDVGYNGNMRIKPSNLHLPVIDTLSELEIHEPGREITEEETDSILQYSAKCLGLKELRFYDCLLPRYIKVTESMSVLRQRDVRVGWSPFIGEYYLNLESGQWEDYFRDDTPMTDEQYQEAVEEVRKWGEDDWYDSETDTENDSEIDTENDSETDSENENNSGAD